jgi:zinc transport system ATP-binding protein
VSEPPVLEIRDLTVFRNRQRLISNVSLDVEPRTIHFLIGPNGAGKSTLFSAVLGLIEFSGVVRLNWCGSGRIGYVPQFFTVDRTLPLTVGEFLAMSRQRRPVCLGIGRALRKRLDDLLASVGLIDFLRRPLGGLSGGELQRVLLANAIDPVPELLLLDEPATGLDESAAQKLEEILLQLRNDEGTGVLMVSHDLAHARRIGDQVTLIDKVVRLTGPPGRILKGDLADALAMGGRQIVV